MTPGKEKDPKHEQEEFDGFRPKKVKEIESAFKKWKDANNEHAIAVKVKNDSHQKLLDIMEEHEVPLYQYQGHTAKLQDDRKLLITKTPKDVDAGEEKEEGAEKE